MQNYEQQGIMLAKQYKRLLSEYAKQGKKTRAYIQRMRRNIRIDHCRNKLLEVFELILERDYKANIKKWLEKIPTIQDMQGERYSFVLEDAN